MTVITHKNGNVVFSDHKYYGTWRWVLRKRPTGNFFMSMRVRKLRPKIRILKTAMVSLGELYSILLMKSSVAFFAWKTYAFFSIWKSVCKCKSSLWMTIFIVIEISHVPWIAYETYYRMYRGILSFQLGSMFHGPRTWLPKWITKWILLRLK